MNSEIHFRIFYFDFTCHTSGKSDWRLAKRHIYNVYAYSQNPCLLPDSLQNPRISDSQTQPLRLSDSQTLRLSDPQAFRFSDFQTLRASDSQTLRLS